jgi:hypothetical protein
VLEDVSNGATGAGEACGPFVFANVLEVGEKRLRQIALEGIFDQPGQSINLGAGTFLVLSAHGCHLRVAMALNLVQAAQPLILQTLALWQLSRIIAQLSHDMLCKRLVILSQTI